MLFSYIISLLGILILIPCLFLLIECLSATIVVHSSSEDFAQNRPEKVAVLIPAHNEAEVIESTLNSILPQLTPQDKLIVVADNCRDNTAEIAQALGATVLSRFDQEKKGKGYALAYGVEFLNTINPDVVILIDADCQMSVDGINTLASFAITKQEPIQAKNLMEPPSNPSSQDLISGFAFLVKNWVRPLGLANLNLPCLLTGTGIAFPWEILKNTSLASSNIVEDMQLGIDLAIAGFSPQFCPSVEIISRFPQKSDNATQQRTRWEHGHLQTLITQVPQLLKASWQKKRFDLLMLAGELAIPPLSLLVLIWLIFCFSSILLFFLGLINLFPLIIAIISGLSLFVSVITAWFKFARDRLPFSTFINVFLYLLWKIPIYLRFVRKPQQEWVKTSREIQQ